MRNTFSGPWDLRDLLRFNFFKISLACESVTGTVRPLAKGGNFFEENCEILTILGPRDHRDLLLFYFSKISLACESVTGILRPLGKMGNLC